MNYMFIRIMVDFDQSKIKLLELASLMATTFGVTMVDFDQSKIKLLKFASMIITLLEILSFATNHYAIGMQLVVVCSYLGHVCNYNFSIV